MLKNEAQEKAIETLEGRVLIIACPGSGKTTTLIRRIHHLIETGAEPRKILMVTFSKMAAEEMAARYEKLYGENPGVIFMTLHSLCFNILKREKGFTTSDVLRETEKRNFLFKTLKKMTKNGNIWELAFAVLTEISAIKNNYVDITKYKAQSCPPDIFRRAYLAYENWKEENEKLDFDDMLLMTKDLLDQSPDTRERWKEKFQYIQCDEYQDTNCIQRDILYILSEDHENLCVVGDDDQAIYGFRGARSQIMMDFPKDFPDSCVIKMGTNYRSGSIIVERASSLIAMNKTRFEKDFVSQRGLDGFEGEYHYLSCRGQQDETKQFVESITERHAKGVPFSEMAALMRTNQQLRAPAAALLLKEIPFFSTETIQSIYEDWIFADIRAYCMLSAGKGTEHDLMQVLNHPSRYLKESAFRGAEYTKSSLVRCASYLSVDSEWKFEAAKKSIEKWMYAFGPGKVKLETSPATVFNLLSLLGYEAYLVSYAKFRNIDPYEIREEYETLQADAKRCRTLKEWFAYAEEDIARVKELNAKKDREGVCLTTMHRSKGLEWRDVYVLGVSDGIVPHRNARTEQEIEEERRLLYVAMTRAKDFLTVYWLFMKESPFFIALRAEERKRAEEKRKEAEDAAYISFATRSLERGTRVFHAKKFGLGTVDKIDGEKITVRFGDGTDKMFLYPDAFAKGHLILMT